MVWQAGKLRFGDFFWLFVPALVNWLVPAVLMSLAVPRAVPDAGERDVELRRGALVVVGALRAHHRHGGDLLQRPPPAAGAGDDDRPGAAQALRATSSSAAARRAAPARTPALPRHPPPRPALAGPSVAAAALEDDVLQPHRPRADRQPRQRRQSRSAPSTGPYADSFDIFDILRRAEWDTLMFFYGIILCVGGLATIGYLACSRDCSVRRPGRHRRQRRRGADLGGGRQHPGDVRGAQHEPADGPWRSGCWSR